MKGICPVHGIGKSDIIKSMSAAERSAVPLSDFADKVHHKYPIDTPARAKSAWRLRNNSTCGCDHAKIASAIKRIAGRKGFALPDTALAKSDEVVLSKADKVYFYKYVRFSKTDNLFGHINFMHTKGTRPLRGMSDSQLRKLHTSMHGAKRVMIHSHSPTDFSVESPEEHIHA